jgi:hypothetical protein
MAWIAKNWKTTLMGVAVITSAGARMAGVDVPEVHGTPIEAIFAGMGLIFGKDGNRTGV